MQKFMLAYYGGDKPKSKEEGMAQMSNWQKWIASLGDTVLNPGTPLMTSKLISKAGDQVELQDDTNTNSMNGYAIIQVETMEAAIEVAKSDPFLNMNGTLRVSQLMDIK